MTIDYTPFHLDGRKSTSVCEGVTYGTARILIKHLIETGRSNHSAQGKTLSILMVWCQHHNKTYTLSHHYIDGQIAGHSVELVQ